MAAASSRDTASESSLSSPVKDSTSASAAPVAAAGDSTVTASGGDNSGETSQNCRTAAIALNTQPPSLRQSRQQLHPRRLGTGTANSKRSRAGRNCSSSSSSTGSSSRGTGDRRGFTSDSTQGSSSSSRSSSGSSRSRSSSANSRSNGYSSKGSGSHCDDAARDDQPLVVHVDVSEDNLDSDLTVRRAGSVSASGGYQDHSWSTPDGQQQEKKQQLQPPREERPHPEPSAAASQLLLRRPEKDNRGGASTSGDPASARKSQDGSRLQPVLRPVTKALKSRRKVKGKKSSKLGVQNLLTQSGLLRLDPAPVRRLLAAGTKHRSLWISGLSISTKICDLRTMFGQYGKVMSASIIKKEEERSLTFHGIVTMATAEEAEQCRRSLNGSQYRGRILEVITHVAAISRQVSGGLNKGNEAGRDRKPLLPGNRSPDCLTSGLQPTGEKREPRDAVRQTTLKSPDTGTANPRERSPLQRSKPDKRVSGSTDRFPSQDHVLQQLHCIADETQRLKEARVKLATDKEFLRSERQLAETERCEIGDVCRQRLRLEREIHELQERCARERADLMRLQELRVRELPPPSDNFRREQMFTAKANFPLPAVATSPVHNSDRAAAGWGGGWQQASPEASFSAAAGSSMTGQRASIQGPVYCSPNVSTDQLLSIGGVLYRVGGGDGNVLVLSRLAVDVQPVVIPGISRVINQLPVDSLTNVAAPLFAQGRDFALPVQLQQPLAREPAADRHCVGSGTSPGLLVDAPQRRSSGGDAAAASAAEQNVTDVHVAAHGGS